MITGPGRSGTSVLALYCARMGYHPGGDWHDAVDAGMEHERVVKINDAFLSELRETGKTNRTLAECGEEMRGLDLAVVKDPRFTYHPAILRAWHLIRPDLRILLTYRKPEHSVASRQRSSRMLYADRAAPDRIRREFADIVETLMELDIPFELVLFPHFLGRYAQVHAALERLGLNLEHEKGVQVWEQLVNPEKVHFKPEADAAPPTEMSRRKVRWNPFTR